MSVESNVGAVALVTGGAKGLGAEIVRAFFRTGASVVVVDIDHAAGEQLCEQINGLAGHAHGDRRVIFHPADITRDDELAQLAIEVGTRFGKLDILVNNACVYADAGLASSREQWLNSWNVNVVGGAMLLQAMRPLLQASRRASVVNLSSVAGKIGQAGRMLYPACKAAILQVTRSEAVELAAEGIRVNSVSPSWTWSPAMAEQVRNDRALADRVAARMHPLGRVGEAEDVSNAVLYLCSDAARFVTAIDLPVDGGYGALGPDQGHGPAHWFEAASRA